MPLFAYTAMRSPEDTIDGEIEAVDVRSAADALLSKGYHVLTVKDVDSSTGNRKKLHYGFFGGIRRRDQVQFTRDLASLLKAGLPLAQSLSKLRTRAKASSWAGIAAGLQAQLEDGATLSQALGAYPSLFDTMYVNLVRAGEEGGTLAAILKRLAIIGEQRDEIRSKVRMAMIYPAAMLSLGVVTVIVLLTFVVPMFTEIFTDSGQTLPLPTLILMELSAFLQTWWWVVLTTSSVSGYFLLQYNRSQKGREQLGAFALVIPKLGAVVRLAEVASFTRTMGTLLGNGIPVVQALEITADSLTNVAFRKEVRAMCDTIHDGERLSVALENAVHFPDLVASVSSVGEESGTLSESLLQVADDYERDLEREIKVFMTLLEPALIVAVGAVVGFIVIAIILPIFQLGDAF